MEPIAIIGIGCRFPKAKTPEAFWQLLQNGVDAISEVPSERWDLDTFYEHQPATPGKMNTRWGGFLEQVDQFDPGFFGISSCEAEHMDPQQRLVLEVAWEALENAGIIPETLAGSQTGVFIGITNADYNKLLYKDAYQVGAYSATGTTQCIAANRLSYLLNLRGPSMALDTACSSSLVAVHLACQSLRNGESSLCLVGGVNLVLMPEPTVSCSQAQMLSPEGRCKIFDASANGYVRGEGCGVIVLKRLSDAVKDGDNILALIRGSAVNHNGLSNSLCAPNGLAQQSLIRQALQNGNVKPSEISYVEAHAVGSGIGDAIEFKALKAVLMEGREPDRPCRIGSVKTNIGHLEAAAGISALIKVILSLQHEAIPAHLHLEELNPYISLENTPFSIPTDIQQWSRGEKSRFAGVSAFGFGGTNAHIILEEAPYSVNSYQLSVISDPKTERPLHLLTLSAKTENALLELVSNYQNYLQTHPKLKLADVCFTANTRRAHFDHRLCLVAESIAQLRQQLKSFIAQEKTDGVFSGKVKGRKRPKIAFFFPDDGSASLGMGYQLYQTQPTFRTAIDKCAEILEPYLEKPLFANSEFSEPALFAIEYALAKLWYSWGIKPKAVMGCGLGEYVAATVAGVFSLEEALKLVAERTRLKQAERCGSTRQAGSPEEMVEAFREIAAKVTYSQPKIPFISTANGELIPKEIATAEYWCRHLQQSENSAVHTETLANYQLVLAMGSKPTSLAEKVEVCLSSFHPEQKDWQEMLSSLGELFVRGVAIDWCAFDRDYPRSHLQLPTYPFQRQRYWFKSTDNEQQLVAQQKDPAPDLKYIETQQIAQLLGETGNFSEAHMELLPELLEVLAKRN